MTKIWQSWGLLRICQGPIWERRAPYKVRHKFDGLLKKDFKTKQETFTT